VEPGRPFLFLPLTMMMDLCPEAVRFFVFFALLRVIFDSSPLLLSSAKRQPV
jgi:hypothetical protein